MPDLLRFSAFYVNNLTLWAQKLEKFFMTFIVPKFVMHVTNDQLSEKFDNGWKLNQNGRFIAVFRILRQ